MFSWGPWGGATTHLWFLYALFLVLCAFEALRRATMRGWLMLVLAICLSLANWPRAFCLNLVFLHFPLFVIGYLLSYAGINPDNWTPTRAALLFCAFAGIYGLLTGISVKSAAGPSPGPVYPLLDRQLLMISGSVACFSAGALLQRFRSLGLLARIGFYSGAIYILHTVPMGIVREFVRPLLGAHAAPLLGGSLILMGAGILTPILVTHFFLGRHERLCTLILGRTPQSNIIDAKHHVERAAPGSSY